MTNTDDSLRDADACSDESLRDKKPLVVNYLWLVTKHYAEAWESEEMLFNSEDAADLFISDFTDEPDFQLDKRKLVSAEAYDALLRKSDDLLREVEVQKEYFIDLLNSRTKENTQLKSDIVLLREQFNEVSGKLAALTTDNMVSRMLELFDDRRAADQRCADLQSKLTIAVEALEQIRNCMMGDKYEKFGSEGIIGWVITCADMCLAKIKGDE